VSFMSLRVFLTRSPISWGVVVSVILKYLNRQQKLPYGNILSFSVISAKNISERE
jgi:hypothetical protein